jgi:hypothetical protein
VIFVRKTTTLWVIGEISKVKKNRYSHIDRGLFLKCNKQNGSFSPAAAQRRSEGSYFVAPLRRCGRKLF